MPPLAARARIRPRARRNIAAGALPLALALASACAPTPEVRGFAAGEYPQRLSDWGLIQRHGNRLLLGGGVVPYDVNTPLFSDYALKLRTVWMPAGSRAQYADDAAYTFPPGTLISKTFFYPLTDGLAQAREGWDGDLGKLDLARTQLMETRLLVRHEQGWDALAYQWRGDEAWLDITGSLMPLQLAQDGTVRKTHYIVPSRGECARCHATGAAGAEVLPIGTTTRQLNRGYGNGSENQIEAWRRRGWLDDAPPPSHWAQNANWSEPGTPGAQTDHLEHLARSYLDANCGHCHNPLGPANSTGLWLHRNATSPRRLGLCKPPIAAGQGTGGHSHSITPGAPDLSILAFRMATTDPAARMPELGRTLVHQQGLAVVSDWIASLPGECNASGRGVATPQLRQQLDGGDDQTDGRYALADHPLDQPHLQLRHVVPERPLELR